MLDKEANLSNFLNLNSKMGHKAVETTHNIGDEFGPGTVNECTV